MLRGLWKLTWLEIKIFAREPMGLFGALVMPILAFVGFGRVLGDIRGAAQPRAQGFLASGLPAFASILIALTAVTSLVTIIAIYREAGILKRLRATPLTPVTILTAHVLVKLVFTLLTLVLLLLAGTRYYPVDVDPPLVSFAIALVLSTWSILSIGFVIASIVPAPRFAQPITAFIVYPLLMLSGLFVPLRAMPEPFAILGQFVPFTYAVSLLRGIWQHEPWSAHLTDVAALLIVFAVCTAISSRVFRWQ